MMARRSTHTRVGIGVGLGGVVGLLLVLAGLAWFGVAGDALAQSTIDYDTDDDGLIDVTTLAQLDAIRHDLNGDPGTGAALTAYNAAFPSRVAGATGRMGCPTSGGCTGYELLNDLDFNTDGSSDNSADAPYANWTPIGTYTGTFEGRGYTISNLNTSAMDDVGLFAELGAGGTIATVGLINPTVRRVVIGNPGFSGVSITTLGPLAGKNQGTINASFVSGGSVATEHRNARSGGLVG